MGWETRFQNNDPSYLEPRISNAESSLAESTSQLAEQPYQIAYKNSLDKTGVTDCSSAINTALSTSGINEFRLSDGTYAIANTIVIPQGKKLTLAHGATLKPTANINVIQLNTNSEFEGGQIDCTHIPSFSNAVFYATGVSNNSFKITNTYAFNGNYTGMGIQLNAPDTNSLFGGVFLGVILKGFNIGVQYIASGTGWVNENLFSGQIQSCNTGIQLTNTDGNKFNVIGQAGISTSSSFIDCSNSHYNYLDVFCFDVGQTGYTQTYAHFYNGSFQNVVTNTGGYEQYIVEESVGLNKYPIKHPYQLSSNGINTDVVYSGIQDNFLVGADKRFTVTETFTNGVKSNGSLTGSMFRTNGNSFTEYQLNQGYATTDNIQININLGAATRINWVGIAFTSYFPQKFVIGIYDGTKWYNKTFDNNQSSFVWWNPYIDSTVGYTPTGNIQQIQFNLYKPTNNGVVLNGSYNPMRIASIMATSNNGGYAFVPTTGGTMYGNLAMGSNYLTVGNIASLPTASATYRGQIIYVQGNGTTTADTAYMCVMSATGTYSWKQIIAG